MSRALVPASGPAPGPADAGRLVAVLRDDPFDPRPPRLVDVRPGERLSDFMARMGFDPIALDYAVAVINGAEVAREDWEAIRLEAGCHLAICIVPEGGGKGNKALTTVLTILVMVAAFWVAGGGLAATLGSAFAKGTAGAYFAAAGVSAIGQLGIAALVKPPSGPQPDRINPVYAIDGATNRFVPFEPILLSVGRRRVFPRQVARGFQELVGDDFYYRMVVEWGPIGVALSDLRVGDTPIGALDGVEMQHRLTAADPHPTLYPAQVFQELVGAALSDPSDWETRRTIPNATQASLVVAFPQGLGHTGSKGQSEQWAAQVEVRYRSVTGPPGDEVLGAWQSPPGNFVSSTRGNVVPGTGRFGFSERKRNQPFYRAITVNFPSAGTWDVSIRRSSPDADPENGTFDDTQWALFESRRPGRPVEREDVAYSVFRFKGTDETSGRIDTINGLLDRLIPRFDAAFLDTGDLSDANAGHLTGAALSSNPWEIILWLYRNGFEGRVPLADSAIDWPSFAAAAKNAGQEGWTFDHVFDRAVSIEEAVEVAAFTACGRAAFIGGRLTAVVDAPKLAPVAVISERTARNVRAVKRLSRPPDGFRVLFDDAADGYRTREIRVYTGGNTAETASRFEEIRIPGAVNWTPLHRLVQRNYRNSRLQDRTITAEVPVDAADSAIRLGAWVGIRTKVIETGRAAGWIRRIETEDGAVTAAILDQPVDQTPGAALVLQWSRPVAPGVAEQLSSALPLAIPESAVVSERIEFDPPVTGAEAPQPGDAYVYGVAGVLRLDGLVDGVEAIDADWLRLNLVNYAPARFEETGFTVPDYTPAFERPAFLPPPELELVSARTEAGQVVIHFRRKAGVWGAIERFIAARALAPDPEDETSAIGAWDELPGLPASARQLVAPGGQAGQVWIYRIAAVGPAGAIGPYLQVGPIAALETLPVPQSVTAEGAIEAGAGGSQRPVLVVAWDPDEDVQLTQLVIELRRVALNLSDERLAEELQPPFEAGAIARPETGRAVLRGLPAGARLDVEVFWRGVNQAQSPRVRVADVMLPDVDIAASAGTVGGRTALEIVQGIDSNSLNLAREVLTGAAWRASQEALLWLGGETVGAVALDARELNEDSALSLSLLGVRNEAGTAFILDAGTVTVPAGEGGGSSAISLLTMRTQHDQSRADLTFLLESVDGASAQATLALDVNGYVMGFKVINEGVPETSVFYILTENFAVVSPGNGLTTPFIPFSVVGGVVFMNDVVVDTLKANSIETENLKVNSTAEILVAENSSTATVPSNSTWVSAISAAYEASGERLLIDWEVETNRAGGGRCRIEVRIYRGASLVYQYFNSSHYPNFDAAPVTTSGKCIVDDIPAGSHTYAMEIRIFDGNGGVSGWTKTGARLIFTELKKT